MPNSAQPKILVANPGTASRKYGLYVGDKPKSTLHFEWENGKIICTVQTGDESFGTPVGLDDLADAPKHLDAMMSRAGALDHGEKIDAIGLRFVAPSSYFLDNHLLDDKAMAELEALEPVAPLHIEIITKEYRKLKKYFPETPIFGISDSNFHRSKPDFAWNYAIPLEDADRHEIKRFGYHGLSVMSAIRSLRHNDRLARKVIIAHLGSGASVTAVYNGKSIDNTMGYSPLEGLMMSTRSGTIDYSAVRALQIRTGMSNSEIEVYLNTKSGLLGLGKSDDIRELLKRESAGDDRARLALATYTYRVQKSIAEMVAALDGVDALVFTGTVGERSASMRSRIVSRLGYLDIFLDPKANTRCQNPLGLEVLSKLAQSKPIYVVHADEAAEIARQTAEMLQ